MRRSLFIGWFFAALAGASALAGPLVEQRALTLEGANQVLAAAVGHARSVGASGSIAVVDASGDLLTFQRLDGTFPAGARVSIGKARTAAVFRKPTRVFEESINQTRTAMVALDDFTPLIGGVPIVVEGQVVGAVGVSGAASAQQDEEIALAGAAAAVASAAAVRAP
jgi:glc operon protein GlcG